MIPGGLLLEFLSYDHIVDLVTVTQVITNLCLNEMTILGASSPYNADFVVETVVNRCAPSL